MWTAVVCLLAVVPLFAGEQDAPLQQLPLEVRIQFNGFEGDVLRPEDTAVPLDLNGDGNDDSLWYRPGSGHAGAYLSNGDGTLTYVEYDNQQNGFGGWSGAAQTEKARA